MVICKSLLIFLYSFAALSGYAQLRIDSIEKLSLPESGKFYHPKLNEPGNLILITAENYTGLQLYNLENKELKYISGGDGAGYSPFISGDGGTILFTRNEYIQNHLFSSLLAYQVPSGKIDQVVPAARDLVFLSRTGDQIVFRTGSQIKTAGIGTGVTVSSGNATVGIDNQKLMIFQSGQSTRLDPFENESYIWPSISPDGKRILAYAMGKGAFICDLEGKLIKELGEIEAPVWADNGYIAGMITKDDGHQIYASVIVLVKISSGESQTVSPEGMIAMYPSVSVAGHKMAFHSADGDVFILAFKITP